jgi:hypothetical protein
VERNAAIIFFKKNYQYCSLDEKSEVMRLSVTSVGITNRAMKSLLDFLDPLIEQVSG